MMRSDDGKSHGIVGMGELYVHHGIPLYESATASLARASKPAETEDHVIRNEDISSGRLR